MCGIAGWVAQPGSTVPQGLADRMLSTMIHRGPDDQGCHHWGWGFIGMRRLSIIDLATGEQPIPNEDHSMQVVQNGEIYNYRELRAELEAAGHRFRTQSDTESIVHLYEERHLDCFARLRGMFGIAIWDDSQKRLVLGRDPLGKKPLFYAEVGGALAFASELKALLEIPELSHEIDDDAVADYLLYGYVPHPKSIFRRVNKLPPGHLLVWQLGRAEVHRYWSLEFQPKHSGDPRVLEQELLERLDEAVRMRLVSDVPWGACLSGGIDSSTIVALMARHVDQPVKTFSIGFNEAEFSELEAARKIAAHVGTDHHELVVEPDAAELLDDLVWHLDEPFADSSAIPTYLVSRMAAEHVKMVLTGDGGDESFGGYTRYRRFLQHRALLRRGGAALWSRGLGLAAKIAPKGYRERLRWLGERLGMPFPDQYIASVAIASPARVEALMKAPRRVDYETLAGRFPPLDSRHPIDAVIAGDIRSYLTDDICVKVDRMSMANSLEVRCPLLDAELVQFAARLPQSLKTSADSGKILLRQVAARLLPAEILDLPKRGFAIPLAEWLRGPLFERTADLIRSRAFRERGIFDADAAWDLLRHHQRGEGDFSEELWSILCFELWASRFLDRAPLASPRMEAAAS